MSAQYTHTHTHTHICIYCIVNRNKKKYTSEYIFHFSIGCFLYGDEKYYTTEKRYMGRHYGTASGNGGRRKHLLISYNISEHDLSATLHRRDGMALVTCISDEGTLLRAQCRWLHERIGKQNEDNNSLSAD